MLGRPVSIPENVVNDLGYTALGRGKVKEAIALFQSNVDANPNSAKAYESLADGYLQDGQLLAAKRAADHCVQLARQWANPNLKSFEQKGRRLISDCRNKRWKRRNPGGTRSGCSRRISRPANGGRESRAALNSAVNSNFKFFAN